MQLKENQLLMLSILIQSDYIKNGDTVREIVCRIESDVNRNKPINSCRMKLSEWRTFVNIINNQHDLLQYSVQYYKNDLCSSNSVACFVDNIENPQDVNIVFRGTHKKDEMLDNGRASYQSDTRKQIEATEYVNSLPEIYGNAMTATGHSKGGNKAQYVTVTTNRIGRCVSFDGLGFSKAFFEKYADEISAKKHCMTAINAADDYVNSIFISIPCKKLFLESDIKNIHHFIEFHKPSALMNEYGKLNSPKRRSNFSKQVSKYSAYLLSNTEKFLEKCDVEKLITSVEKLCNVHTKLNRRFFQPIWDFLIIFIGMFILLPSIMPLLFGKGLRLVLSYICANINYLRVHRYILKGSKLKEHL